MEIHMWRISQEKWDPEAQRQANFENHQFQSITQAQLSREANVIKKNIPRHHDYEVPTSKKQTEKEEIRRNPSDINNWPNNKIN